MADTPLNKNETVNITIYSYEGVKDQQRPCNANQIAMPDLSGLYDMYAAEEVSKYLYDNAGICASIKVEYWNTTDKALDGKIASQYPVAEAPLDKNKPIDVTIYVYKYTESSTTITNTTEPEVKTQEAFIERMYSNALGRGSDAEGLNYWKTEIESGRVDASDLARGFLCSKEFLEKDMKNDDFVDQVYMIAFGRHAEDEGKKYWVDRLENGLTRDQLIQNVLDCPEWCNLCATYGIKSGAKYNKATVASTGATAVATELYKTLLNRDPEKEGLDYWSMSLTNGDTTCANAIKGFINSKEYTEKNIDNETFVTSIYKIMLGRTPDAEGLQYWIKRLENGDKRDLIVDSFANAPEFINYSNSHGIN